MTCEHKGKFQNVEFLVVEGKVTSILGLQTCKDLNLIKQVDELTKNVEDRYQEVFQGHGCMPGKQHLKVKANVKPVVHAPRRVPVALRQQVKDELKRMERLGVIERVTEPCEWVSSMVTIVKPNRKNVRICIDPQDLNKALEREYYPMKTVEQITDKLPKAKMFTTLDANSGYWQVQLDEESSKLCTFNTEQGRFKFLRLPFGINVAPEIYQRIMNEYFLDLEGVEVIMDDIVIFASDEMTHNERLEKVLKRCKELNITLNKDKCRFRLSEVKYMGHILSADGLKPDPAKIEAINRMKAPSNKQELMQFLGMVTYLAKFIKNLSSYNGPIEDVN